MVARTGFEPVISALRGRRPEPLDERAKSDKTQHTMAGMEGVEPPLTEPESAVLPLDDIPIGCCLRPSARENIIREVSPRRKREPQKSSYFVFTLWSTQVREVYR